MKSYVKRPFVIKALQWDGTIGKLHDTEIWQHMVTGGTERGVRYGILRTPEGDMKFHKGDYIVKGVCGEIYPVKKEIFEKTYREASDPKKDAPFKDGPDLEKLWAEQEKQLAESDLIVVKKKNLLDVLSMAIKTRNTFPLILPCLGEGTDCCKSGGHCTHDDCPFYNDAKSVGRNWIGAQRMMNKYEKALKCIRILCLFKSDDDEDLTESDKETIQSLDTFQELVEKATPKEPIYQGDGYVDGELVFDTALCPNCNAEFEYGYGNWGDPYCPKCGQALDWVDDEDA